MVLYNNDMNRVGEDIQMKQQLSKFINLLQNDYNSAEPPSTTAPHYHQHPLPKKLSIILSASEPESSSLDKDTHNPSFSSAPHTPQQALALLLATPLTSQQTLLANTLRIAFEEMREQEDSLRKAGEELRRQLGAERQANDEMLKVLMELQKQEKEVWKNYNLVTDKQQAMVERNRSLQEQLQQLSDSLNALQNDNDFMKKLIFHANQNYQALQRKCNQLQTLKERHENQSHPSPKRSSADNLLLKSAKTRKHGRSPSNTDLSPSPSPPPASDFQQIYRKMILRTLKFKGKQGLR